MRKILKKLVERKRIEFAAVTDTLRQDPTLHQLTLIPIHQCLNAAGSFTAWFEIKIFISEIPAVVGFLSKPNKGHQIQKFSWLLVTSMLNNLKIAGKIGLKFIMVIHMRVLSLVDFVESYKKILAIHRQNKSKPWLIRSDYCLFQTKKSKIQALHLGLSLKWSIWSLKFLYATFVVL